MAEYLHVCAYHVHIQILNSPPPTHTSTPEEDQDPLPLPHTTVLFCDPPDIPSYTTAEPGDTVPSAGLEDTPTRSFMCQLQQHGLILLNVVFPPMSACSRNSIKSYKKWQKLLWKPRTEARSKILLTALNY